MKIENNLKLFFARLILLQKSLLMNLYFEKKSSINKINK